MRSPLTAKMCVAAIIIAPCGSGISPAQDYAGNVNSYPDHQPGYDCGGDYQDSSLDDGCQTCQKQPGLFSRGLFSKWLNGNSCLDGNCGTCSNCRSGRLKDRIGNWQTGCDGSCGGGCDGSCGGGCDQCADQTGMITGGMAGPDIQAGSCGCKKCRLANLKQKFAGVPVACDGNCGGGCDQCVTGKRLMNHSKFGQGIPRGPATGLTMFSKGSLCKGKGCRGCDQCQRGGLMSRIANANASSDCGCDECQQASRMSRFASANTACDGSCGGGCDQCQHGGLMSRIANAHASSDCGCDECQQASRMSRFASANNACDGSCGGGCDQCQRGGLMSRIANANASSDCGCDQCQQASRMSRFASANNSCDGSCGGGCDQCASRQGRLNKGLFARNTTPLNPLGMTRMADASSCQGSDCVGCTTCQGAAPASNAASATPVAFLADRGRGFGCQDGSCGGRFSDGSGRGRGDRALGPRDMGFGPIGNGRSGLGRGTAGMNEGSSGLLGIGRGRGTAGCGRGGCGTGGRLCGACGQGLAGEIPHTAQAPYPGFGGQAPTYAYPYYTTRGPRDFLQDNPPSIGW